MNRKQACSILEVNKDDNLYEIKKKYRSLIRKVHPDAEAFHGEEAKSRYSAQEINEAYEKTFIQKELMDISYMFKTQKG